MGLFFNKKKREKTEEAIRKIRLHEDTVKDYKQGND